VASKEERELAVEELHYQIVSMKQVEKTSSNEEAK